jgi:hypothetical protein
MGPKEVVGEAGSSLEEEVVEEVGSSSEEAVEAVVDQTVGVEVVDSRAKVVGLRVGEVGEAGGQLGEEIGNCLRCCLKFEK